MNSFFKRFELGNYLISLSKDVDCANGWYYSKVLLDTHDRIRQLRMGRFEIEIRRLECKEPKCMCHKAKLDL